MDILVVDDDAITRIATAQTLQSVGYRVSVASNAEDALLQLSREHQQLVVCDRSMPGMSGLDFCRAIRSRSMRRYIYVLMLTCHNRPEDALQGFEAGADDYVAKPFNPAELILRVNTGRRIIRSESRDITIFTLAKLAESRDPETGAHLERVRGYCRVLAEELQANSPFRDEIDEEFVRLIYETSPLHDIGKVAIPDAILLKPGKLTMDEFEVMKTHTLHGARTLAAGIQEFPNAEFLRMAHAIALCHHEKFDGSGYPHGLSGENIPLPARIVALADVYDALTSKRVYKKALAHREARQILGDGSGKHFDPYVVGAFWRVEEEFREVQSQFLECDEHASPDAFAQFGFPALSSNWPGNFVRSAVPLLARS